MFSNGDAGDVGSLEEVFRSDEFGRATEEMGGGVSAPVGWEDVIFTREFGRPPASVPWQDVEGEAEPLSSVGGGPQGALFHENEVSERPLQVAPSPAGAALEAEHVEARSERHATRFGTIASVSALVALAAAGIMAGVGHHPRSNFSAQGQHDTARPHGVPHPSGAASTGSTAPGGPLTSAAGSGGLSSGTGTHGRLSSGNEPAGRVTLIGPSTFAGSPVSPVAPGNSPGGDSGTTGSPPPSGGTNPAAPVASTVGSTLSAVGSSVTTAASQIGSSVPSAAPTTGVVNRVVSTLDQAVSASTE